MKSWGNREGFHRAVTERLVAKKADDQPPPTPQLDDYLAQWLAQLTLLYGVPVEYLVPDYRMLPPESIRFFYLDRNWLDRMVDGAMSVGVLTSKDQLFNQTFFEDIYQQVDLAQMQVRTTLRASDSDGLSQAAPQSYGGTMSGLLMRSRVVSDYPGVEINGYDASGNLLHILRMDHLSDSLLICLFAGVPVEVDFVQPSEGLHFGIQNDQQTGNNFIYLRGLGYPNSKPQSEGGYPGGLQIQQPPGSEQYVKAPVSVLTGASEGVLDVKTLVDQIQRTMQPLPNNPLKDPETGDDQLTPGGFAIQMVVTAGIQPYKITTPDGKQPQACPEVTLNLHKPVDHGK